MAPQLRSIGNFDNFVKGIFYNGISKTCGNIGNLSSFFLSLLYLGIHKYSTACSKVNGVLCKKCCFCKILYTVIQGFRKGLDKRAAAGGACLIELYAVNGVIFDLNAFHILSADVQNTVYIRIKKGGGIIMGNGFHFALIQQQCRFDQCFSVTGGTGPGDMCIFRQETVDLLDGTDGGSQRIAVIIAVKRVEQCPVFSHKCCLGSCGTGIDTQIAVSFISGKLAFFYFICALPFMESIVILLGGEKGFHTGNFKIQLNGIIQLFLERKQRNRHLFSGV